MGLLGAPAFRVGGALWEIADAFQPECSLMSEQRARETARVSNVVGREGRVKQRMTIAGLVGGWAEEVDADEYADRLISCDRPWM
jgi:hypothetical protein